MKKLLVFLAPLFAAPCISSASVCTHFNGNYIDSLGHKQTLKTSADCKSISWKTATDSKTIFTDSVERKVTTDFLKYNLYVSATYQNENQLVLNYRLEDIDGTILSQSKSQYDYLVTDVVKLTESNFSIAKDATETLESQQVLMKVH